MPAKGRDLDRYVDAVIAEMSMRIGEIPRPIKTAYLGGGTPSILPAPLLAKLIKSISDTASEIEEFTIEANPEDINQDFLRTIKRLGINRISMGVQSFDDQQLSYINRMHNSNIARVALNLLKESGINFNADLIFGLPGQTLESWLQNIDELITYRPNHISAYLLSYEPGTLLHTKLMKGMVEEASETLANEMYSLLVSRLRDAGYIHYEISNNSLPGFHSRHNSSYWDGTPYLGLGVSAHSFDGRLRRFNPSNIKEYISNIESGKTSYKVDDETTENRFNDIIITTLRTSQGLDLELLKSRFPQSMITAMLRQAQPLVKNGMLIAEGTRLRIPEALWLTSDAIMRELIL